MRFRDPTTRCGRHARAAVAAVAVALAGVAGAACGGGGDQAGGETRPATRSNALVTYIRSLSE